MNGNFDNDNKNITMRKKEIWIPTVALTKNSSAS